MRLYCGDALTVLATLPAGSVQTCITSPPYWGLRDYRVTGQLGLERTPEEYVAALVAVFAEVRRVLRDDGTLWLNLGSSYSNGEGANLTDCLNRLLEGGSIFFADTLAVAVSAHRVQVAAHDQRAPDQIFSGLLAPQGDGVEDGHKHLPDVADLFARPRDAGIGPAVRTMPGDTPDSRQRVNGEEHRLIVCSDLDTNTEAELVVLRPPGAWPGEDHETTFAVDDADEPRQAEHVRWHSSWDTFALHAARKGAIDVDLVDDAVALRDRHDTIAGLLCDFRVAEASAEKLTLASIHGGLGVSVTDIRHAWFALRDGSVVPYRQLYARASRNANEMRAKQDVCIPWRVAMALQGDGWILRAPIIWAKPNPMPESVTDRPTKSHEYLFLLAKAERYYYDAEAIREQGTGRSAGNLNVKGAGMPGFEIRNGFTKVADVEWHARNRRSVWTVATAPFPGLHFATFPPDLIKPCVLAGTSERGGCSVCGAPWERVVERIVPTDPGRGESKLRDAIGLSARAASTAKRQLGQSYQDQLNENPAHTTGWRPTCDHDAPTVPQTVLDPFAGAGTTLYVAKELGRESIGIELNPAYIALAEKRCAQEVLAL